jgi:F0F1-type ATP synthase membrane subunit b/b'
MAKRAKASEPSEPERETGIVAVDDPHPSGDEPVVVEPKPERPPAPPSAPSGPSFGERVGRFFRFLLRLISLLLLLSLLSLILYLTLPWFYQTFIRPVEQNTTQVRELHLQQKQMKQEIADLQTKLGTLETAQNQHDGSLTDLNKRLSDIETEITARTESLTALEKMQTELQTQNQANSAELKRQVNLLKGMELLSRARLFMYESNFGLARQDVQIAHDLLAKIQPEAPQPLGDELAAVVQRLDMVLSNLPDFPVAASDDLDIAWQILLTGLPTATPTLNESPSPTAVLSVTATAIPPFTPTPQMTMTPSISITP